MPWEFPADPVEGVPVQNPNTQMWYVWDNERDSWAALRYNESIEGEKGNRGEKGEKGVKGAKGWGDQPGVKGDQGVKGEKGDKGIKGIKGEKGIKGRKGDTGILGTKGEKGIKGESVDDEVQKGEKGEKGIQGLAMKGNKGEWGFDEKGNKGIKGEVGEPGEFGNDGENRPGNEGPRGPKGWPGDPGDYGEDGNRGNDGNRGDSGTNGGTGARGNTGHNGPNGQNGSNGRNVYNVTWGACINHKLNHDYGSDAPAFGHARDAASSSDRKRDGCGNYMYCYRNTRRDAHNLKTVSDEELERVLNNMKFALMAPTGGDIGGTIEENYPEMKPWLQIDPESVGPELILSEQSVDEERVRAIALCALKLQWQRLRPLMDAYVEKVKLRDIRKLQKGKVYLVDISDSRLRGKRLRLSGKVKERIVGNLGDIEGYMFLTVNGDDCEVRVE